MSTHKKKILIGLSILILALALCGPVLWAVAPPEVILESHSEQQADGLWIGPAIIWIDGARYDGNTIVVGAEVRNFNPNSFHGTEIQVYEFVELGTLVLSGVAKTSFRHVTPLTPPVPPESWWGHRWHYYTSHTQVVDGATVGGEEYTTTGAFAEAHGVVDFEGYTEWYIPPPPIEPNNPLPYAWIGGKGSILGIQLP